MPKETFNNLNSEKRNRIIDIALDEFATNDYNTSSLNSIVKKADISKGSLYQYFENKKDLYMYLLDIAGKKKFEYIRKDILVDNDDFFILIKKISLAGAKFDLTNPQYSKLILNAINENSNEELGDISNILKKRSDQFFYDYVKNAQEVKNIRTDLDSKFISFVISRHSMMLIDYITDVYDFSYNELINNNEKKMPISNQDLENILDDFLSILKRGLIID